MSTWEVSSKFISVCIVFLINCTHFLSQSWLIIISSEILSNEWRVCLLSRYFWSQINERSLITYLLNSHLIYLIMKFWFFFLFWIFRYRILHGNKWMLNCLFSFFFQSSTLNVSLIARWVLNPFNLSLIAL